MKNKFLLTVVAILSAMGLSESSYAVGLQNDTLPTVKKEVSKNDSIYTRITGKESFECSSVVDVICKGDTFYIEMPVELIEEPEIEKDYFPLTFVEDCFKIIKPKEKCQILHLFNQ